MCSHASAIDYLISHNNLLFIHFVVISYPFFFALRILFVRKLYWEFSDSSKDYVAFSLSYTVEDRRFYNTLYTLYDKQNVLGTENLSFLKQWFCFPTFELKMLSIIIFINHNRCSRNVRLETHSRGVIWMHTLRC